MIEHEELLGKTISFITTLLNGEDISISLSGDEISYLCQQGMLSRNVLHVNESVIFYFEDNRLFELETTRFWFGTYIDHKRKLEIIFYKGLLRDRRESEAEYWANPKIIIEELYIDLVRPKNKLIKWIRSIKSDMKIGGIFYNHSFSQYLFNSNLDFSQEQLESALKKVTSVEILDNHLIVIANNPEVLGDKSY
jgi:hypothetical protein